MNSELYRRLKEYAEAKIISQSHSSKFTRHKRFRRDSVYNKFVNSMKDDSNKDQKEKILKEQMDELIDQGFKDAAQNQRILTPKNKNSPKNKTKQGSPKKGLMKLKTIRDAKMGDMFKEDFFSSFNHINELVTEEDDELNFDFENREKNGIFGFSKYPRKSKFGIIRSMTRANNEGSDNISSSSCSKSPDGKKIVDKNFSNMLNIRKETKIKNKNSDNITKINAIQYYKENEGRLFRKPYHKYLKIPILVDDFSKERDKSVFTPENTNLRYLNTSDTRRCDGQNDRPHTGLEACSSLVTSPNIIQINDELNSSQIKYNLTCDQMKYIKPCKKRKSTAKSKEDFLKSLKKRYLVQYPFHILDKVHSKLP